MKAQSDIENQLGNSQPNGLFKDVLTWPNLLTFARLLLIIPFGALIWRGDYSLAFYLALIAAASDGLDRGPESFQFSIDRIAFDETLRDAKALLVDDDSLANGYSWRDRNSL